MSDERLREALERMREFAEHSPNCVFAADLSGVNGDELSISPRRCSCGFDDALILYAAALAASTVRSERLAVDKALEALWDDHDDAAVHCGFNRVTFDKHRDAIVASLASTVRSEPPDMVRAVIQEARKAIGVLRETNDSRAVNTAQNLAVVVDALAESEPLPDALDVRHALAGAAGRILTLPVEEGRDNGSWLAAIHAAAAAVLAAEPREAAAYCAECGATEPSHYPGGSRYGQHEFQRAEAACRRGSNPAQGIDWHWCTTHDAEFLLSATTCNATSETAKKPGPYRMRRSPAQVEGGTDPVIGPFDP